MEENRLNHTLEDVQTRAWNSYNCEGERVFLVTEDMLCIEVDKLQGNIMLRGTERSDIACIFRKHVLEMKSWPNGRVETVVFALDCHPDFYLTTSSRGHLELDFRISIPRVESPDERTFDLYFTKHGHVLIQPKLHSNMYLHHKDHVLSVKPLDLNERCPEEYFFHFDVIPEDPERNKPNTKKASADFQAIEDILTCNSVIDVNKAKVNDTAVKKITGIIELPLRMSAKNKICRSILFFGCFSDIGKR